MDKRIEDFKTPYVDIDSFTVRVQFPSPVNFKTPYVDIDYLLE